MWRPRIAITMGDPAGIGPEVAAAAAADPEVRAACAPVLLGDPERFALAAPAARLRTVAGPETDGGPGRTAVVACGAVPAGLPFGRADPRAGLAALEVMDLAIDLALRGRVDGVATAPVNKAAIAAAGVPFTGHTERFAERTGAGEVAMLLLAGPLRVAHVSTHVSLRQALARVRSGRVLTVIHLLDQVLRRLQAGGPHPRLAVAGLNPHAGEGGLFGDEDRDEIAPAVAAARAQGVRCEGPLPPDTVFWRAGRGEFDGVVAMYHDQGHIPCKLLGFEDGVNVTLGLPIVRTSVDHGTAFDIAGAGRADAASMKQAVLTAARLAAGADGRTAEPPARG